MKQNLFEPLIEKARMAPKSIAFPETTNGRIIQAAGKVAELAIARPVMIGNQAEIENLATSLSVTTAGFNYYDNNDEETFESVLQTLLDHGTELSEKSLRRKLKNSLNFAAALVAIDWADTLAAGIDHATTDVLMASQAFIGLADGIETISSMGIVEAPGFEGPQGQLLGIADCAVCTNPTASELADIACASADTMRKLLGWEPKVALLCFSTDGSGQHEITEKVVDAVRIANQRRPDLLIDGEFQLDAAIFPEVAAKKVKRESKVAGQANIIIFPDLNAGNIGVKLIQTFGKALAHGPLLQGFRKPVSDFSRSAPVDEIVGNLIMLVNRASA